jgi:predicted phosphodiesterase
VGQGLIRIVSDVHYAERSSRVKALEELRPLLSGADRVIFNGDTVDTRPGGDVERTARLALEVKGFFASCGTPVTLLTGNHDPRFGTEDHLELEDGRVLVTHGDVLFESIVPWSGEAPLIRDRIRAALAALPLSGTTALEDRLRAFRDVEATIRQRHQAETNPLRYLARLANDTVWPPYRCFEMARAWREAPRRAASLASEHRPRARCIVIGHTHRPGIWRAPLRPVVVNTGSFTLPFGAFAADVSPGLVTVRRIERVRAGFRAGPAVGEVPLS